MSTAHCDRRREPGLFEAHPWAAAISAIRPPLGPGLMAKYEHELSALDGLRHAYDFGLQTILDGLAVLIETRSGDSDG